MSVLIGLRDVELEASLWASGRLFSGLRDVELEASEFGPADVCSQDTDIELEASGDLRWDSSGSRWNNRLLFDGS